MTERVFRIGTRASALALWQANWVAEQLRASGQRVEIIKITTSGDQSQTSPLRGFGGVGVFVKELERALLNEHVDLAVHSLKDLPTERVEGLLLAAVPPRAAVQDALISRQGESVASLPPQARVGTGSARRRAFLCGQRADLTMAEIRGNVDTRLAKLTDGEYDAIVLAVAGLERLGWGERITQRLPLDWMLPAVGQGALGIECRASDTELHAALSSLDDPQTHAAVVAERTMLAELRAGCLAPVGAWARVTDDNRLTMNASVATTDGSRRIDAASDGDLNDPAGLGQRIARQLSENGAAEIIAAERDA